MRIISGMKKKMVLYGPKTKNIRPTTDRAKESLFNILNLKVKDSVFLDLFAGSGAISLEAKSRGAKEVYAIDNSNESILLIKKNQEKTNLDINIVNSSVKNYVNNVNIKYDIIFLDPPFNFSDENIKNILNIIFQRELLKEGGTLILERETNNENEEIFSEYKNIKVKKYGKVSFVIKENI